MGWTDNIQIFLDEKRNLKIGTVCGMHILRPWPGLTPSATRVMSSLGVHRATAAMIIMTWIRYRDAALFSTADPTPSHGFSMLLMAVSALLAEDSSTPSLLGEQV